MRFLGCLLMLFFVGFFVIFGLGMSFLQAIIRMFSGGRYGDNNVSKPTTNSQAESEKRQQVFSDDEGEYVDFEEVK